MPSLLTDTTTGVGPFRYVIDSVCVGPMTPDLPVGVFGSMLTVGAYPGREANRVHHRHIPLDPLDINYRHLDDAATWVRTQSDAGRRTLIRSEGGCQRPTLVAAVAILLMGGREADALACCAVDLTDSYRTVLHHFAQDLARP